MRSLRGAGGRTIRDQAAMRLRPKTGVFTSLLKAVGQLRDPAIRRIVWIGLGAAVAIFAGLWTAVGYLLDNTTLFAWGWLETVVDMLGWAATLLFTWLLFPAVYGGVGSLLLDGVARAVEARHHPHLPEASGATLARTLLSAARFLSVMVGLNLFLLVFLAFPPVFPFVYYAVNGYLLSREYFELVALRRVGVAETKALRKARRGPLFLTGLLIALLLTVPVVNLLAPIIATAAMVHLFESWRADGPAA